MKKIIIILLATGISGITGCSFLTGEFSYMQNLKKAVSTRYHTKEVGITLKNSDELIITFKDQKFEDISPEDKQQISREIGILVNELKQEEPLFKKGKVEFVTEENFLILSKSNTLSYDMYGE